MQPLNTQMKIWQEADEDFETFVKYQNPKAIVDFYSVLEDAQSRFMVETV